MSDNYILNTLQSAAGFSRTASNAFVNIQKEKARVELDAAQLQMNKEFNDYLLGLGQRNDFGNFKKDWDNKKVEIFNTVSKNLSTPFARDTATQMFKESDLLQTQKIQVEQFKREADFTLVGIQNNINERNNDITKTHEQRFMENQYDWKSAYDSGLVDYSTYNQKLLETGTDAVRGKFYDEAKLLYKDKGLPAALEYISANTYQTTLLNGAKVPMDGIKEAVKNQIIDDDKWERAYRNQIQQEKWKASDNSLSQIWSGYLATGKTDYLKQGIGFVQNSHPESINPDDRNKYMNWFRSALDDSGKDPAKAKQTALESFIRTNMDNVLEMVRIGQITPVAGKEAVLELSAKDYSQYTGEKISRDEVFKNAQNFTNSYFDGLKKIISNDPTKKEFLDTIKNQTKPIVESIYGKEESKFTAEQKSMFNDIVMYLEGYAWDLVYDNTFAQMPGAVLKDNVTKVINEVIGKKLTILQKPITDGIFGFEKQAAEKQDILNKNNGLVYIDSAGIQQWAPGAYDAIANMDNPASLWSVQRNDLAKTLGLGPDATAHITVQLSSDSARGNDSTGTALFTDQRNGTRYRYQTDDKGKMVLQKAAKGETDWTTIKRINDVDAADIKAANEKVVQNVISGNAVANRFINGTGTNEKQGGGGEKTIEQQAKENISTAPPNIRPEIYRYKDEAGKIAAWVEYLKNQGGTK